MYTFRPCIKKWRKIRKKITKKKNIYICKNVNNVPIMKKENKSHSKPKVKPVKPIDCLYSSTTARSTVVWGGDVRSPSPPGSRQASLLCSWSHAVLLPSESLKRGWEIPHCTSSAWLLEQRGFQDDHSQWETALHIIYNPFPHYLFPHYARGKH